MGRQRTNQPLKTNFVGSAGGSLCSIYYNILIPLVYIVVRTDRREKNLWLLMLAISHPRKLVSRHQINTCTVLYSSVLYCIKMRKFAHKEVRTQNRPLLFWSPPHFSIMSMA